MKVPAIILAALVVGVATPAMIRISAQANRPGMPTPAAPLAELTTSHGATCGLATLRGTYAFSASGFNIVAGVAQPKAIVEVIEFNGDGTLSVPFATVSINGVIMRSAPSVGTYTVANDCTGTVLFVGPAFDVVIARDTETIWMVQTNPNTVMQGTATKTSRGRGSR